MSYYKEVDIDDLVYNIKNQEVCINGGRDFLWQGMQDNLKLTSPEDFQLWVNVLKYFYDEDIHILVDSLEDANIQSIQREQNFSQTKKDQHIFVYVNTEQGLAKYTVKTVSGIVPREHVYHFAPLVVITPVNAEAQALTGYHAVTFDASGNLD